MSRRAEAAARVFMRLSGIALLFLAVGHMLLMHVVVGVNHITFGLVAARWGGLGWRAYDLALLLLAMSHGAVGIRGLAFEHVPARLRTSVLPAAYAFCLVLTTLGAWVIVTFPNPV